jgi:hypothetical protein
MKAPRGFAARRLSFRSPIMTRLPTVTLILCLAATPVLAQASAQVRAGNLSGSAQAGTAQAGASDRDDDDSSASADRDRQVARGPRTDDTRNCDTRGVTVRSGNGSASSSASVTTSGGGSSVVAGGGSPGSRTEYFGCDAPTQNRSSR